MTISPNKFYRTRDGRKARVYATDGVAPNVIHGAVLFQGEWHLQYWTSNGMRFRDKDPLDLISEWIDTPEVDWSAMPKWAKWVARDGRETWHWYDGKPTKGSYYWVKGTTNDRFGSIPSEFAPTFTGEWTQSLVERPQS